MIRKTVAVLVCTLAVAAPAAAATTSEHSGRIVAMDPTKGTFTLEEMGPWKGPETRPIDLSISLTPRTDIELVHRARVAPEGWRGGYVETPLQRRDVRQGDFATVKIERRGNALVADSIEIVRPARGDRS